MYHKVSFTHNPETFVIKCGENVIGFITQDEEDKMWYFEAKETSVKLDDEDLLDIWRKVCELNNKVSS